MFKNLMAKMGMGGATVDTRLGSEPCQPGGVLTGNVVVQGGQASQRINGISVSVRTRAKRDAGDGHIVWEEIALVHAPVSGPFDVQPGEERLFPLNLQLPYELPINLVGETRLPCEVFLRTHLDIDNALDAKDADPIAVRAHPAQRRILLALSNLGFPFFKADIEYGRIQGAQYSFYQEIEFRGSPRFSGTINELEVTFLARANDMDVIFELDRRASGMGGWFGRSFDDYLRVTVPFAGYEAVNWEAEIERLIVERLSGARPYHEHQRSPWA